MQKGTILYVEDEESDAFFLNRAFQKQGFAPALRVLSDGRQALDYLAGKTPYQDREKNPLPSVVLLDIHLPGMSGLEVLCRIRHQPELQALRVVIFSSSAHCADRAKALELGADAYLQKPSSGIQFGEIAEQLELWLGLETEVNTRQPLRAGGAKAA